MTDDPIDFDPDAIEFKTADPDEVQRTATMQFIRLVIWALGAMYICVVVTFGLLKTLEVNLQTKEATEERLGIAEEATEERLGIAEEIRDQNKDIQEILNFQDSTTSPEATAESQARLAYTLQIVLERSDCQNREVVQQLAEELVESGILRPGDLTLRCPAAPAEIPGTPTTVPG